MPINEIQIYESTTKVDNIKDDVTTLSQYVQELKQACDANPSLENMICYNFANVVLSAVMYSNNYYPNLEEDIPLVQRMLIMLDTCDSYNWIMQNTPEKLRSKLYSGDDPKIDNVKYGVPSSRGALVAAIYNLDLSDMETERYLYDLGKIPELINDKIDKNLPQIISELSNPNLTLNEIIDLNIVLGMISRYKAEDKKTLSSIVAAQQQSILKFIDLFRWQKFDMEDYQSVFGKEATDLTYAIPVPEGVQELLTENPHLYSLVERVKNTIINGLMFSKEELDFLLYLELPPQSIYLKAKLADMRLVSDLGAASSKMLENFISAYFKMLPERPRSKSVSPPAIAVDRSSPEFMLWQKELEQKRLAPSYVRGTEEADFLKMVNKFQALKREDDVFIKDGIEFLDLLIPQIDDLETLGRALCASYALQKAYIAMLSPKEFEDFRKSRPDVDSELELLSKLPVNRLLAEEKKASLEDELAKAKAEDKAKAEAEAKAEGRDPYPIISMDTLIIKDELNAVYEQIKMLEDRGINLEFARKKLSLVEARRVYQGQIIELLQLPAKPRPQP